MSTLAIPGQILATTSSHNPGPGTHVFESKIYASLIGTAVSIPATTKSGKPTISVPRSSTVHSTSIPATINSTLPAVGTTVLCRITRVQRLQASASILVVTPSASAGGPISYSSTTNDEAQFQALLRREDVRAYEKDKVVMNESFRVGDVVRAVVISLGDERNYYISTAGDELGVVVAKGEEGGWMVPASWREMRDLKTGKGELRKVAKPV